MQFSESVKEKLFTLKDEEFESLALEVFHFQAKQNEVYAEYIRALNLPISKVKSLSDIPFLPLRFYKSHQVLCRDLHPKLVFESSGTTGSISSRQFVADPAFYEAIAVEIFTRFYGQLEDYCLLALLPSYLERKNASLAYMAQAFMKHTLQGSGFFLNDYAHLKERIKDFSGSGKILLLGVTFGLLDMAENLGEKMPENSIIMETGGMKGRRKEMVREEIHATLKNAFGVDNIHSEYGMTELTSQGYARQNGYFETPTWMRILLRDMSDPFSPTNEKRSGGINIIDLANIDTCAFLETQDIGSYQKDNEGTFKVLGRYDNADLRGCNLMVTGNF